MAFELLTMTTVRMLDVRTLASKDREPDEPPGAQLLVQATLPVAALAMFDPALPGMLARRAPSEAQGRLEGIEKLELTEIGQHVKRIPWVYEQTGNTIELDRGLGGSSNLKLQNCKVHGVSFAPQEGVSAKVQWTIDVPALSDAVRGKLTGMKATEIPMTQVAPQVSQIEMDAPAPKLTPAQLRAANAAGKSLEEAVAEKHKGNPFPKTDATGAPIVAKAPDATDTFVAQHGKGAQSRRDVPPAKYRDPDTLQSWSGRGLKPKWLVVALEQGKKLSDFQLPGAH